MSFIKNYQELAKTRARKIVLDLVEAAFSAIRPEEVISKNINLQSGVLQVQNEKINLAGFQNVYLLGFGKGSAKNAKLVESILGDKLTRGFVIDVNGEDFKKIEFTQGTHPLPSQPNLDFTKKVIDALSGLSRSDLVIIITCGGGSALFEVPNNLPLDNLITLDIALLKSGADIKHINMIRKHVSQVKGGKLAKILYPATILNLIFSDVPGNDFSTIASGPTVRDDTEFKEALDVFNKYNLGEIVKPENLSETPKDEKYFQQVKNVLMLSNLTALSAMQEKAKEMGIAASIYTDKFQQDANVAGKILIDQAKSGEITLVGGETTVVVKGSGEGGRNQQLVLSTLSYVAENIVIASFDSDGWDNSPAAGAIADNLTVEAAKQKNLDSQKFQSENNSYSFFNAVGDAILTSRVPSNVSDLMIVYKK